MPFQMATWDSLTSTQPKTWVDVRSTLTRRKVWTRQTILSQWSRYYLQVLISSARQSTGRSSWSLWKAGCHSRSRSSRWCHWTSHCSNSMFLSWSLIINGWLLALTVKLLCIIDKTVIRSNKSFLIKPNHPSLSIWTPSTFKNMLITVSLRLKELTH